MKEQYIRQVEKHLTLPRKAKQEVIRDLNEIFASALENGETEQQVIDRLGTPEVFAENTAEQFGGKERLPKNNRTILSVVVAAAIAVVAFVIYQTTRAGDVPDGVIGQANAMTNIQVEGGLVLNVPAIILWIGIVAAVFAVVQIVRVVISKWRQ